MDQTRVSKRSMVDSLWASEPVLPATMVANQGFTSWKPLWLPIVVPGVGLNFADLGVAQIKFPWLAFLLFPEKEQKQASGKMLVVEAWDSDFDARSPSSSSEWMPTNKPISALE